VSETDLYGWGAFVTGGLALVLYLRFIDRGPFTWLRGGVSTAARDLAGVSIIVLTFACAVLVFSCVATAAPPDAQTLSDHTDSVDPRQR